MKDLVKLLRLFEISQMSGVLEHHFLIAASGSGVFLEHCAGLPNHGLGRVGVRAGPTWQESDLA